MPKAAASSRRPPAAQTQTGGAVGKPSRPPTAFETRLYKLCSKIPSGKVTTYGAMAKALVSSPRAVGQALRRNPCAPTVPCHRVIASTLELGGFSGSWGVNCPTVKIKRALLANEGVNFDAQGKLTTKGAVMEAAEMAKLV